jgi:hypothetical protein
MNLIDLAERAILPDWLIRIGIRRVLALSNSRTQRESILSRGAELSIQNIEVLTINAADFDTGRRFDRVRPAGRIHEKRGLSSRI